MKKQYKTSLSLIDQLNTTDSWLLHTKTTPQTTFELKKKLYSTRNKTKFQEYKLKLSKPKIQSKESSHSLLGRFQAEFQKTFSRTIAQEQNKMLQRMSSINPDLKANSFRLFLKPVSKPKIISTDNVNINSEETTLNQKQAINDEKLSVSLYDSSKVSSAYEPPLTYSEPNSIISKARLRTYDIKYNDKWKDKAGLAIQDIKYSKVVIRDMNFQHNYIKDEMRIIFDNYQHYKRYFLSKKDLLIAFKNKTIRFQIAHNMTIEETISFLNKLPLLILKDFNQYTDDFIGAENISRRDLRKTYITNEANCFVYNIHLLNRLILFVRCCFEVYLTITKQVNHFVIKWDHFNLLRGLLERIRYNTNEIIAVSKACLNDLHFEKNLIEKYHPILIGEKEGEVKKAKLSDLIHEQFQFNKNEQSQKLQRMENVLCESEDEENKKKRKRRIKVRNGHNIIAGPMELIVSL